MKKIFCYLLTVCVFVNILELPITAATTNMSEFVNETREIDINKLGYATIDEVVSEYESGIDYEAHIEGPIFEELPDLSPKKIPMGTFRITYYCGCYSCSEGWGNMTATGVRAREGRTIAVDPSVISYGTSVYIEGIGEYIAEDCGGAIKGNDIDIYLEDHDRVYQGGVDYCNVWILRD